MSIFIIGWPIGIAAGQAIQGPVAVAISWNAVFFFTSFGCGIALLAISTLYRPPTDIAEKINTSSKLTGRELWLVCVAGVIWMFINGAYLVLLSFGPTFLLEQGESITYSGAVVSVMSWVFMFSLPLGGYLATRYQAPNVVAVTGMAITVIIGVLIPYTALPLLTFAMFGIAYAIAVPIIAALPVEVLKPENRGPGLGVYYIWYYAGSAFLPVAGGLLKNLTGQAATSILFGAGMMLACLMLLALFRREQARLPL